MENNINAIRTFNRFELKYLLSLKEAEAFKDDLRPYMTVDTNGNDAGRYRLGNLYYDSPILRCYQEKENGVKVRRKLRIRYYESDTLFTEEKPVFVEIKQRNNRVTQKRRIVLPYFEALQLCNDRAFPNHLDEDRDTYEEIIGFVWQYNLRPSMIVRYKRTAFVGKQYDIGLRVTFDTNLVCQPIPLHLHEQLTGLPFLDARKVVMEIKVNDRIPIWLTQLIGAHNIKSGPFSKYCRSIDVSSAMPGLARIRTMAESASDVLSSSYSVYQKQEREYIQRNRK